MQDYLGLPEFEHGSTARRGVLLVNLGTPEAPTPGAVRKFLAEFLWDPRVVEAPRWLWWLALHGVILRVRPGKSAHAYQQIWTPQGSPLLLHCRELADRLQASLHQELIAGKTPDIPNRSTPQAPARVALAMTYGSPSIADTLLQMQREGVRQLLVLPLYPQYSGTTTAAVFDRVTRALQLWRWVPELRFITQYHDEPTYVSALARSIEQHWRTHPRQHLIFSFHGVPQRYLTAGDPYYCQCQKTARLVCEQLGLGADDWSVSFQSQVGREEWLRPYTNELLVRYAQGEHRHVTLVCPGFATDCLETLEEIVIRNRELFLAHGGLGYDYVPALNASDAHVNLLAELVLRHTQGWLDADARSESAADTKARAVRQGARS